MIDCGLASYMQAGQVGAGKAAVERETEGRTRAAEYLMQHIDWDLLIVVYSLPDVWQHYYWAALCTSPNATGRDLIYDGYRMLDQHMARLLAHLPQEGAVIICSDHGFGPLCGTRDHINRWLAGQGLLHYREDALRSLPARVAGTLLAQARRRVSFRLRQQLLASVPILRRAVETQLRIGGIDWSRTQVYAALDH
jgi:predicted AlkP superfamily phosphohydrolase/phosphomutase